MDSPTATGPDEDKLYDASPTASQSGYGPEQGFNSYRAAQRPDLFTEEAKKHPAIREFLDAPFSVSFMQFKSSTREAEYFIHKPHRAMSGHVDGIVGSVERLLAEGAAHRHLRHQPRRDAGALDHARSLAIEDGAQSGAIDPQADGARLQAGQADALPGVRPPTTRSSPASARAAAVALGRPARIARRRSRSRPASARRAAGRAAIGGVGASSIRREKPRLVRGRAASGLRPLRRPGELHRPRRVAGSGGGPHHPVALLRGGARDRSRPMAERSRSSSATRSWRCGARRPPTKTTPSAPSAPGWPLVARRRPLAGPRRPRRPLAARAAVTTGEAAVTLGATGQGMVSRRPRQHRRAPPGARRRSVASSSTRHDVAHARRRRRRLRADRGR